MWLGELLLTKFVLVVNFNAIRTRFSLLLFLFLAERHSTLLYTSLSSTPIPVPIYRSGSHVNIRLNGTAGVATNLAAHQQLTRENLNFGEGGTNIAVCPKF
jgi:hypothetical protein